MKKSLLIVALVAVLGAGSAFAEGVPSQSKLDQLGLSSMNVVSDQQGEEVRGQGFGAASITFTLTITAGVVPGATVTGTQSNVFGQDPQSLNNTQYGGTGFGGFDDNAVPNFSTFTSTPLTINTAFGGNIAVASIQGFIFGNGR